jgi:hypothetical protein
MGGGSRSPRSNFTRGACRAPLDFRARRMGLWSYTTGCGMRYLYQANGQRHRRRTPLVEKAQQEAGMTRLAVEGGHSNEMLHAPAA